MIQIPQHGNGKHYKTNICRHFELGNCSIGNKCQFAHGQHELRKPSDPLPTDLPKIEANLVITNFKTVLCKYHQSGFCKNGTNCSYAHGQQDRKEARLATLPKTEVLMENNNTNTQTQKDEEQYYIQQMVTYFISQLDTLLPNLTKEDKSLLSKSREYNKQGLAREATNTIIQILQSQNRDEEDRYIYQSVYKNALVQYQNLVTKQKS